MKQTQTDEQEMNKQNVARILKVRVRSLVVFPFSSGSRSSLLSVNGVYQFCWRWLMMQAFWKPQPIHLKSCKLASWRISFLAAQSNVWTDIYKPAWRRDGLHTLSVSVHQQVSSANTDFPKLFSVIISKLLNWLLQDRNNYRHRCSQQWCLASYNTAAPWDEAAFWQVFIRQVDMIGI